MSGGALTYSPALTPVEKFPGTASISEYGEISWINSPDNIKADDGVVVGCNYGLGQANTDYIKASNYGFSIPENAIIKGIQVIIEKWCGLGEYSQDRIEDSVVKLIKPDGTLSSVNYKQGRWSNNWWVYQYGSNSDLWGETWTLADINNSNFGVAYAASLYGNSGESFGGQIDYIKIKVYYTFQPQAIVVWKPVTATEALAYAAVVTEQNVNSGTIAWYLSDDGANWIQMDINTVETVNFDAVTVFLKCVITSNASISAVAWGGY
ncbi:hypothetical protein SDC9_161566 [bioreactor metagenome]|uniref:Uncharacterized protein n=1 Tax=bioreactor metagenome TaxID=1076179 RepID=A0A645FJU8_9ZZZZ